jgi:DNA-binding MarR family transcriptional regulator
VARTTPPDGSVARAEQALERLFRFAATRTFASHQRDRIGIDVSRAGYAVLRCIDDVGEPALGRIARTCAMDPATVGRQVRQLEADGLVERSRDRRDGRVTVVRFTDAGWAVYGRIVEVRTEYLGEVLAGWTSRERRELVHVVDRLVADLRAVPVDGAARVRAER